MFTVLVESDMLDAMYNLQLGIRTSPRRRDTKLLAIQAKVLELFNRAYQGPSLGMRETRFEVVDADSGVWETMSELHLQRSKLQVRVTRAALPVIKSVHTAEQLEMLLPLSQHLAALRISAFFRAHTSIMLDIKRCAREVYSVLGWGWTEKTYQEALKHELDMLGYRVTSEIPHPIYYKGRPLGEGVYVRSDVLVEDRYSGRQVLVELKSVPPSKSAMDKAAQQVRRYLGLTWYPAGIVINFPQQAGQSIGVVKVLCSCG